MSVTRVLPSAAIQAYSLIAGPSNSIFTTSSLLRSVPTQSSSSVGAWYSANRPLAYPFRLNKPETVYELGWDNGSAASGNADIGIYDESWNRIISTGSTAVAGTSTIQWTSIADTVLARGKYYLVGCRDNVTASTVHQMLIGVRGALYLAGCYDSGTNAFPLPNPLTNMVPVATATNIPGLYMAFRASPL